MMITQHLLGWLWIKSSQSLLDLIKTDFSMVLLNTIPMLGASIFIGVSGWSMHLYSEAHPQDGFVLIKRGAVVFLLGMVLNLISPNWFTPSSWYVLHLLGVCIMLSPLLNRLSSKWLWAFFVGALTLSVLLQTFWDTPLYLVKRHLNPPFDTYTLFHMVLAEGYFPLFPWMGVFVLGIIVGRMLEDRRALTLFFLGIFMLLAALILVYAYDLGWDYAEEGDFYRLFIIIPYMFPAYPAFILLLSAGMILFFLMSQRSGLITPLFHSETLASLGRLSLTILFVHSLLFNEVGRLVGTFRRFNIPETLGWIVLAVIAFAFLARFWCRRGMKYSLEQLIRKLAG